MMMMVVVVVFCCDVDYNWLGDYDYDFDPITYT
jgi:hypothetical protein